MRIFTLKRMALVLAAAAGVAAEACTGFYVGKKVSADGTTIIARTVDSQTATCKRFEILPHVENAPGRHYLGNNTTTEWPLPATTYKALVVPSVPAAVLIMFAMVSAFGIDVSAEDGYKVIFVLMAIACGSASYWFTFSGVFSKLRKAVNLKAILWINRLAGIAVVGFGLYSLVRGIISFIKL